jgi:hypothetical protein
MRWYILRTLMHKEALRHATNRGGLALAGLLVTASLLLAALNPAGNRSSSLVGGVHHCFIHAQDGIPLVEHLMNHVPPELKGHILCIKLDSSSRSDAPITYRTGTGAFQIRNLPPGPDGKPRYHVWLWHPAGERAEMAIYETWFWRETYRYFHEQAETALRDVGLNPAKELPAAEIDRDDLWLARIAHNDLRQRVRSVARELPSAAQVAGAVPELEMQESPLKGSALDTHAAIATALVMFALFFTCVYLMPSLTCEERERGLLLAQALSPASPLEIVAAKFLFYPAFGILLATLLAGIHSPATLARPFFWLALLSLAVGSLGIGMTIASLARSQRTASMGALCYMLAVALLLLVCQQNNIAFLPYLSLEYHAPNILHATLTDQIRPEHWINLIVSAVLAIGWVAMAAILFRKRGWQ